MAQFIRRSHSRCRALPGASPGASAGVRCGCVGDLRVLAQGDVSLPARFAPQAAVPCTPAGGGWSGTHGRRHFWPGIRSGFTGDVCRPCSSNCRAATSIGTRLR
jgi:hypothetical protein